MVSHIDGRISWNKISILCKVGALKQADTRGLEQDWVKLAARYQAVCMPPT